ncbi:coiled-coil domain-containing 22 homolog, partial [Paramuricea clavata]
ILVDTRSVQKDINQLSGKLSRTFKVTDELIFKDAKKDEACRKAYRYLASLHENCEELVKCVEETGVIMREIRDLEEQAICVNKLFENVLLLWRYYLDTSASNLVPG